jgi:hypothetical protein
MSQTLPWSRSFNLVLTVQVIFETMRGERDAGDFEFAIPGGGEALSVVSTYYH